MPYLPEEPSVYPADLFVSQQPCSTDESRWWVTHTKPRQEKCLARDLYARGINFYLPLISKRQRYQGSVATAHLPLFPGYVAIFCNDEERITALDTRRIVQLLSVPNQRNFWQDLHRVNQLIASGMPITREDRMAVGDRVVICDGPLVGLEGTIIQTSTGRRFLVQVDFIQRGASVLADDFDLEVVA